MPLNKTNMDQTNKNSSTITTPVAQVASVVITPVDINNNDYSVINLNGNQDESGGIIVK